MGSRRLVTPESSKEPLSMGELIALIDTARQVGEFGYGDDTYDVGLVDGVLAYSCFEANAEEEDLRGFVTVTSAFYPELASYYNDRVDRWVDDQQRPDLLDNARYELEMLQWQVERSRVKPRRPSVRFKETIAEIDTDLAEALRRFMRYRAGFDGFDFVMERRKKAADIPGIITNVHVTWMQDGEPQTRPIESVAGLAALVKELGSSEGGDQLLEEALAGVSGLRTIERAHLAYAMGETERADGLYKEAEEDAPAEMAKVYLGEGRLDEVERLRHSFDPSDPNLCAACALARGDTDEAVRWARAARQSSGS
jgi:hypothetical protein